MPFYTLIPLIIIVITCLTSYIGWNNATFFQRYQFHVSPTLQRKQYYRLITAGFLHADGWHLFFNMFTLYFFSRVIAYYYGAIVFTLLYFGAIVAGNAFSLWLNKRYGAYRAIGASGGVSGVLFAAIALAPMQTIYLYFIPITAWIYATLYFAYSVYRLLNPVPNDYIGHDAHLGGAAFGLALVAVVTPAALVVNGLYIGIMTLPLIYLAFELLFNKKARRK